LAASPTARRAFQFSAVTRRPIPKSRVAHLAFGGLDQRAGDLDKIQSYFGFTTLPFGRALAPGMLFSSADHAQAAARIGYGIATRGITVITGEVGVGKPQRERRHHVQDQ
jgi:type II secretory pathway predicted ATPase ExeA